MKTMVSGTPQSASARMISCAAGIVACCVLLGGVRETTAAEVTKSVRATGMAAIVEGDISAAFERAKDAALKEAVEEAFGVLVSSSTRGRNFEIIEDHVLTKTSGYVSRFSVVDRRVVGDDTYEVTIDAVVDLGNLEKDLAGLELLMEVTGRLRILCGGQEYLLSENGDRTPLNWRLAEVELVHAMTSLQGDLFTLLPAGGAAATAYLGGGAANTEGSHAATAARAGQDDATASVADIAVIAEVTVRPGPDVKIPFSRDSLRQIGLVTAAADVQVRAWWTDTGEIINTVSGEGRGAGADLITAGRKVAGQLLADLAQSLAADIVADLREKAYSGRIIQLQVHADTRQLRRFEERLPLRISGIEKLYPRSYESGFATFDARAVGAAFDVARQLSARRLGDLGVEILQVSANSLKLKLSN